MITTTLPVPVLEDPHWRVNIRPTVYKSEVIKSLADCFDVVQATKVSLRGWDYPHLSRKAHQQATGKQWVASWSDFLGHREYWRFYQSGQFIHLFAVREAIVKEWHTQLRSAAESHGAYIANFNWDNVPGYLSLLSFLYSVTEIFEFASRLTQRGVYSGEVEVTIELRKIRGFVLIPDFDRAWSQLCIASEENLGNTWRVESLQLIAASADLSLSATTWFFERLGWLRPSVEVLRRDQEKFLSGRL